MLDSLLWRPLLSIGGGLGLRGKRRLLEEVDGLDGVVGRGVDLERMVEDGDVGGGVEAWPGWWWGGGLAYNGGDGEEQGSEEGRGGAGHGWSDCREERAGGKGLRA
ncbi:MAG: hypothetical protein RI897_2105 [Verrucomicrobiota bacterium]